MNKTKKSLITNSLTLSTLNCAIGDFSSEVLKLINDDDKGDLYKKFICKFLTYVPVDYRSSEKTHLLYDFTNQAFEFFLQNKNSNKRKVDIISTTDQNHPSISILVSIVDKPFVMDSLKSLMSKLNLQIVFSFHPVISTVRDEKGNLQEILDKGHGSNEALVYMKIYGNFEDKIISKIRNEIHNVLDLVEETYNSWQTLLNKIIEITTNIAKNKSSLQSHHLPAIETLDFLNWIEKNNMTFLGSIDFDTTSQKITNQIGVKEIWQDNLEEISSIIEFSESQYYNNEMIMMGKINKLSPVHRNALVDYILIKHIDENGKYQKGTIIFGLYGTAIYFQSIKNIPILREKMNYVLDKSGFSVSGYNAKKIKNIIESLPRDILIQISQEDLYCMCLHMLSSMSSRKLKLFIQQNWSCSFINVIIFLPRENLTPESHQDINNYLSDLFGSDVIEDNVTVVAQDFAHLFTTIAIKNDFKTEISSDQIEQDLTKITTSWSEGLFNQLSEEFGEYQAGIKHKELATCFPSEYTHKFDAKTTIDDIHHLMEATEKNIVVYNLKKNDDDFSLNIYSPNGSLILSDILPSIENLGFIAIDEQSFHIKKSQLINESWIYSFKLSIPIKIDIDFQHLKHNVQEALNKIRVGLMKSDSLSKLLALCGFRWIKIKLLRSLTRYLHQTGFSYGKGYVQQTLIKHYKYTKMLVEFFDARFNPKSASKENAMQLLRSMNSYIENVKSSSEDKVLQSMRLIIEAITRTNFYQLGNNDIKGYLSFKFDSSKVPNIPLPIPYAEIFVYSSEFEGVHLRGGKVARGGLRWSDRGEDYRTEVLALMKSQMTKNTVIVPVGSKGTFYLTFEKGQMSYEDYMAKVVECYKDFLRGLLDVTDNLIDSKIIHPHNTVVYDEENPYLVVAADKGTATFSDYANEVSKEYNFWLGDAFASGGSVGYDHKKMAITSTGAWISAQSHFADMGVDIQKEKFTVVGIGDMSGDVFGNGMLLSKYICLVAAFNHQHIFIDPKPDHKTSYQERKRLFDLPRSKWSDYDEKLISPGGGVFDRSAKLINLSEEIKQLLELDCDSITPDRLIQYILKAKVDLIWNGGIGTYIKSSSENNLDIGDKANDLVRVNGQDVVANVISEGGNVGLSQLGRIEYALNGGRINTDFIDNSAGVDCSDHEVNIKIALGSALSSGKINLKKRNAILESMTEDVKELVLIDNYNQNLAITISLMSNAVNTESFSQLIDELENSGLLNSDVEFLPNKSELSKRKISNEKMTRPELSILLSYSKMYLDNELSNTSIDNEPYFNKYLLEYFPKIMQNDFKEEIENHPLRTEIIRTVITNKLVNQLGGPLISAIKSETGAHACDIARAHAVIVEIFNIDLLWQNIINLDSKIDTSIKVELFSDLDRIMRRGITWFVRNVTPPMNVNETIEEFSQQTSKLKEIIENLLVGETKIKFFDKINHYTDAGVENQLAKNIATLEILVSAFDIIHTAKETNTKNMQVANLYFQSGELLNLDWLRQSCESQMQDSYWNRLAIQSLKDDLYDKQRRLIKFIISDGGHNNFKTWLDKNSNLSNIFVSFVLNIRRQEAINFDMIILASKKLEIFLRKLGA